MTERSGGMAIPSTSLLDAVLTANNKWRCEMWALRLHKSTPPEVSRMVAIIMDRQLELEEEAKASNHEVPRNLRAHPAKEVTGSGMIARHKGCGGKFVEVGTASLHSITIATYQCDKCDRCYDASDQVFEREDKEDD
jgi:hypothetical protein